MEFQDFPRAEYERRISQLQEVMARERIDAILISDESNLRYSTGHFTDFWSGTKARKPLGWIPKKGEPILIVNEVELPWAQEVSWCSDVRAFGALEECLEDGPGMRALDFDRDIARVAIEAGRERGLDTASRIGVPRSAHMRADIALAVLAEIEAAFEGAEWVDASGLLWDLRSVKSDAEIDYMRRATDLTDVAFGETLDKVKVGMSELELARLLRGNLWSAGADALAFTSVCDLRLGYVASPSPRRYRDGALVHFDAGAAVRGYSSDHCRLVSVGAPDPATTNAYAAAVAAYDAGVAAAKPGATAAQVATAISQTFEEAGAKTGSIGRVGHGTGMEQPEPPSLHPDDDMILREGMVIDIEPSAEFDGVGLIIVEDMFVITDEGAECLSSSPTPRQLPAV